MAHWRTTASVVAFLALPVMAGQNAEPEMMLQAEPCRLTEMAFSHDGTLLAAGDEVGYVYVWDVRSGEPLLELYAGEAEVAGILFSPDGRYLFTIVLGWGLPWRTPDSPALLTAWRLADGEKVATWGGVTEPPCAFALSQDGQRLLVSANSLRVLTVPTLETIGDFDAGLREPMSSTAAYCMAAAPDDRAVMGGADGIIRVVSAADGRVLAEARSFEETELPDGSAISIESLVVSSDGNRVWYGAYGSPEIRCWSIGAEAPTLFASLGDVQYALVEELALTPWGDVLASVDFTIPAEFENDAHVDSQAVSLWDVETGSMIRRLPGYVTAAFHPEEPWIACAKDVSSIDVFDYNTGKRALELPGAAPVTLVLLGAQEGGTTFRVRGPVNREVFVDQWQWVVLRDIPAGEYEVHASSRGEPEGQMVTEFVGPPGLYVSCFEDDEGP